VEIVNDNIPSIKKETLLKTNIDLFNQVLGQNAVNVVVK